MESTLVIRHSSFVVRRAAAVVLGAVLVAIAAQIAVPLPGTPVPMTLQPMAVLLVGGLLGPELGAISMVLYLAMGAAGLPVFTPSVPVPGIARLFGATGGYLLAYPIAAYAVGRLADVPTWRRVTVAVFVGLLLIHLGGLAQLLILTHSLSLATRFGTWPFLLGDLMKLALLVPVLVKLTPAVRARL